MVSAERMEQIRNYVAWWRQALDRSVENRTRLLHYQTTGLFMTDETGADLLAERIAQEDHAVLSWQRGLTYAESLLGRAQAGQDV